MDEVRSVSQDDEIDLLELFETIWDGKWLLALITACSILIASGYIFLSTNSFTATTEIKPITRIEVDRYWGSNALDFYSVSSGVLFSALIEELESGEHFTESFRQFQLVDKDNFASDGDYEEAVRVLASSVSLIAPQNTDGAKKGEIRRYWTLKFDYQEEDKWVDALSVAMSSANNAVREALDMRFRLAIDSVRIKQKFELEDITTKIQNLKIDYDRKTSYRLAFLKEQAAIARKLGVSRNSLETQNFSSASGLIATVNADSPFYLRGYDSIEKEIELIEMRENKEAFVVGLLALQQAKRAIEQDKILERAEELFELTPIATDDEFKAASFEIESTEFYYKRKSSLILAMSIVLGGMIGVIVVLTSGAMRKRRQKTAGS